jgi:hypothetical protein
MPPQEKQVWRSPEEVIEVAFQRSRVVMMNEAHDGWRRCLRTRQIGQRILPAAHQMGIRHLAMEALYIPSMAQQWNVTRHVPEQGVSGYPSQPEMRDFIQSALDLGWTLIPYEADAIQWLATKHTIDFPDPDDPQEMQRIVQAHQAEVASLEFTNWRETQQDRNLFNAFTSLPPKSSMLVWCGNSHNAKQRGQGWSPMAYQFREQSGMDPFTVDQTRTVKFNSDLFQRRLIWKFSGELKKRGGTAGFLREEMPSMLGVDDSFDATLLSVHNDLE